MLKKIVYAILVVAIAREMATATWLIWDMQRWQPTQSMTTSGRESHWTDPLVTRISPGVEWLGQLFGESREERAAALSMDAKKLDRLPVSSLSVLLIGVLYHDDPAQSLAVFLFPFGQERVLRNGAMLPEGARLIAVLRDRVLIKRNGVQEQLLLPDEGQREILARFRSRVEKQREVSHLWQKFTEKPEEVLRMIRLNPAEKDGKLIGVRLDHGVDPAFLGRFGLQPGDVVIWLNGESLDSYEKGIKALRALTSAQSMHFKVQRGEQYLDFTYNRSSDDTLDGNELGWKERQ
ncbi:MAG: type II secretion system protein GspC [Magnetococcales bacterium]|nr:type II secretion system protein GspC [Magnetococcales bacterium]